MRRADVLWHHLQSSSTYADVTVALGNGTGSIVLAQGDKLYVGATDWLSGLLLMISQTPVQAPTVEVETYDGTTNSWKRLPLQERYDQLSTGHSLTHQGYDFRASGMVYWGTSPHLWTLKAASRGWPESASTPNDTELFWVRLRNTAATPVTLDRVLPVMYTTYATVDDVAEFIGLRGGFTEETDPTESHVRRRIRAAEDWLDNHTRRSWRMRMNQNERHTFNPHGLRLKRSPVWFVQRLEYWVGDTLVALVEGRNKDFYVIQETGLVYFTRVLYGRGMNWMTTSPRYLRQADSVEVDYVYGADFETNERRDLVQDTILKRVASDLVNQMDWTSLFMSGGDSGVPKPEKVRAWREESEQQADSLRGMLIR